MTCGETRGSQAQIGEGNGGGTSQHDATDSYGNRCPFRVLLVEWKFC